MKNIPRKVEVDKLQESLEINKEISLTLDLLVRLIYQPVVVGVDGVVGVVDSVDVVVGVVDSVVGVVDSVEVEVVVVVVVGHASSAQLVVSSACDPSTSQ